MAGARTLGIAQAVDADLHEKRNFRLLRPGYPEGVVGVIRESGPDVRSCFAGDASYPSFLTSHREEHGHAWIHVYNEWYLGGEA